MSRVLGGRLVVGFLILKSNEWLKVGQQGLQMSTVIRRLSGETGDEGQRLIPDWVERVENLIATYAKEVFSWGNPQETLAL